MIRTLQAVAVLLACLGFVGLIFALVFLITDHLTKER